MNVYLPSSGKGDASPAEPEINLGSSQAASGSEDPEVPFALATSLDGSPVALVTGPPQPPPVAVVTGPPQPPPVAVVTGRPQPPESQSQGPVVVYSGEQARHEKNRNCLVVLWIMSVACCVCCVLPSVIVAVVLLTSIDNIYIIEDDDIN
jgi:hypothetical protein